MEWSTKTIEADRPFGSWAEDLADAFVQLEPRKIVEQPFQGKISRTDVASVQISRVEATKHVVLRLRSHIARSIGDAYFVNLQLDGVGRYTQRGIVGILACFALRCRDSYCQVLSQSDRG
jgi:hypothetical protein